MKRDELFKNAIKENNKMIFGICSHFFNSKEDAMDAYQEILLKIWLNIEKFRGESQLKTWINRIAVNVCITYLAKAKRKSSVIIPLSKSVYSSHSNSDEMYIDDENKLKFFQLFMDGLNSSDRMLVSLYLEDLGTKEISLITGLSESNVRVKIHRIRNQIRKEWEIKYGN